ncbi:MAG TPA: FtsX-like permease family protein [Thermoanaerobaculia bacterium]|nr:FtsX-like permease family protein [Thermoanaerobaculia bacterium]
MIGRLVLASLRRRPRQLALILAAVLVAAATVATLAAFSARVEERLGAGLAAFGPNLVVRPQVGGPDSIPASALARVRAIPGVLAVSALASGSADAWTGGEPAGAARAGGGGEGAAQRLEVRAEPARLAAVARAIEERVEGVEATPLLKTSASDARLMHRLTLVLVAVSGVSFLLALLAVGAATAALVGERRVEVGLMLALGYSGRRIGAMLAVELLAAALIAALAGELLGEAAAGGLERHLLGGAGGPVLTWSGLAGAAAVAALVVGTSLAVALRRIERLNAAVVLRGE